MRVRVRVRVVVTSEGEWMEDGSDAVDAALARLRLSSSLSLQRLPLQLAH